ncbi:SUMF1/EgtB/PvdO family nonheme iron enzyme [bacterium]|nr:SUMF1/EgtB/PvdO family nonheme iron enzyme [bacterium]
MFKNSFDEVLWEYLEVKDNEKDKDTQAALVIFIDDLDRCPLPKIVNILETIKLFMDKKGCIFVLGAAKEIIEKAMQNDSRYDAKDADEFLEKIIQINFPLPKKIKENSGDFIKELVARLGLEIVLDDKILNVILPIMEFNPRRIIALFNDVSLQLAIVNHNENGIAYKKLLLWKTLEKYEKGLFNTVIKERKYFIQFLEDLKIYEESTAGAEYDEVEIKKQLKNPDWIVYFNDTDIRLLLSELDFNMEHIGDYDILVHHTATLEPEVSEEEELEVFLKYIKKIERSIKDAPGDYKEFISVADGKYDLEELGEAKIRPFALGKYSVTNKWFREFMNEGGYTKDKLWSPDGIKWLRKMRITEPAYWQDKQFYHPGKPVIGVSWWEAEAFINWINSKKSNFITSVRLPTEEEWLAAAGKEKRTYSWGNEWNPAHCNNSELDMGSTSIVGIFGNDNTPDGISDMTGNVWEWTSTKDYGACVICGGSWGSDAELCRVSGRGSYHPGDRGNGIGFRLAHGL